MLAITIPAMLLQTKTNGIKKPTKLATNKYTNCRGWWWFLYNVRYFAKAEKGFNREWAECESTIWKFPNKAVFRKIRKVSNEEKSRPILFCYCLFTEIASVSNESVNSQRSIQKVKDWEFFLHLFSPWFKICRPVCEFVTAFWGPSA